MEPVYQSPEERDAAILAQFNAEQGLAASSRSPLVPILLFALAIFIPLAVVVALKGRPQSAVAAAAPVAIAQNPNQPPATHIAWYYSFETGQQAASMTGKKMMVSFYTDWCGYCRQMDSTTYVTPSVIQEAQNVIPVKINGDSYPHIKQRYNIQGFPTVVWMDAAGNETARARGANGPEAMLAHMQSNR